MRPTSKLVLHVAAGVADGVQYRVLDESGLELVAGRFHGAEPQLLTLPAGSYRVALLDRQGAVLSEWSMMLGSDTVELELGH